MAQTSAATAATATAAAAESALSSAPGALAQAAEQAATSSVSDELVGSQCFEAIQRRLRSLRRRLAKIEKYETMAKSELNADQVLAIQRKPEVTAIIKELEELARQTSIFDAEEAERARQRDAERERGFEARLSAMRAEMQNALRGQLDSFLLTWYALHSALPHVPASSGLSPAKLSALLSLKSALSGAGVPLAGLPALVAQARHHAELIAAASPAAVPGSTVSYAEISGVVADLVCPPPPPRFGSLVEPDSAETPHGTQDAPEADAHEQRPVARRAAAGISFFSPSEILGETAQSDESAALLAAAPPSVATPLGLDDQAELASGVEAEGEAQIADIAGDDGDQAPAPQPSADDAAEAVPNGEPAVRSDGRETSPSKAAASGGSRSYRPRKGRGGGKPHQHQHQQQQQTAATPGQGQPNFVRRKGKHAPAAPAHAAAGVV